MQVYLDLSTEGTPGSGKIGKGLDLFDQPMLGATPFNQNVNFVRAQQAELARTIMQIDSILHARVHIVRPEPSPFIREQKPTTASVMLKLRPGATLNRSTISGIGALVSGSIEGLTRENVHIIDATGRQLSENGDSESGIGGTVLDQRKEMERYLGSEAERVLAHVLGPGRAIVRVTVEMNNKLLHEKREIINADGKVPRSEKIVVNKFVSSGGAGKGGVAGSSSNFGKGGSIGAPVDQDRRRTNRRPSSTTNILVHFRNGSRSTARLTASPLPRSSTPTLPTAKPSSRSQTSRR